MNKKIPVALAALLCAGLGACGQPAASDATRTSAAKAASYDPLNDSVPRAICGEGSQPETDIQGRVPVEDRVSGRSQEGYRCNLELLGQYQGVGSSWVSQSYGDCAYLSTHFPGSPTSPGTQVVDVSDTSKPVLSTTLSTPGMLGTWESLRVNEARGLLGGTFASSPSGNGPLYFDLYDIKTDCAHPVLLASIPTEIMGHEGAWAPDGNTYYTSSTSLGVKAIDTTNASAPAIVADLGLSSHGLSLSEDGNRAYLTAPSCGNGLKIVDVSQIQGRMPDAVATVLGEVCWSDGSASQGTIPVKIAGKPYVIFFDEGGQPTASASPFDPFGSAGAARIIDISDETRPVVVSKLKLEIHLPENVQTGLSDIAGTGVFGYQAHYCAVDQLDEPTVLACEFFNSGIRVFDIRDPLKPVEIAYYNPPAQTGKNALLLGSEHGSNPSNLLTADWCSSPPRFIKERGELWASCQDNGFMVLKFTNGVWPIAENVSTPAPVTPAPATGGLGNAESSSKFGGGALGLGLLLPLLASGLRRRWRL